MFLGKRSDRVNLLVAGQVGKKLLSRFMKGKKLNYMKVRNSMEILMKESVNSRVGRVNLGCEVIDGS